MYLSHDCLEQTLVTLFSYPICSRLARRREEKRRRRGEEKKKRRREEEEEKKRQITQQMRKTRYTLFNLR